MSSRGGLMTAIACALVASAANAQQPADPPTLRNALASGIRHFALDWENDSIISGDGFYTNGIRFALRLTPRVICIDREQAPVCIDAVDRPPATWLAQGSPNAGAKPPRRWITGYSLHIANNIYTASDIEISPAELAIARTERPYAGWAYVGVARTRTYNNDRVLRLGVDLGCLGPCAGSGPIQTWWHDYITPSSPTPLGWSTQIGNEPVVLVTYRDQRLLWPTDASSESGTGSRRADLAGHFGAQLGNIFTTASAGLTARLGIKNMRSYFVGHGLEPALPSIMNLASGGESGGGSSSSEVFAFVRAEGRFVGYNATIEGRLFGGPDPFARKPRRAVADFELGLAAQLRRCSLVAAYAARSTEIETREFDLADHRWGHVRFTYRLR